VDAARGVNQSVAGTEQTRGCKQERRSGVKGQATSALGSHCGLRQRCRWRSGMMALQRESDLKVKYAFSCCPGQGAMHRRRLLSSALLYLKLVGHHHWRAFVNLSLLQRDRSRCCCCSRRPPSAAAAAAAFGDSPSPIDSLCVMTCDTPHGQKRNVKVGTWTYKRANHHSKTV